MITKFSTIYAGLIDLPDMGQDAILANEAPLFNERLAFVFDTTSRSRRAWNDHGYHTLWLAEQRSSTRGTSACRTSS